MHDYARFAMSRLDPSKIARCFGKGMIRLGCCCAGALTEEVSLAAIKAVWKETFAELHGGHARERDHNGCGI